MSRLSMLVSMLYALLNSWMSVLFYRLHFVDMSSLGTGVEVMLDVSFSYRLLIKISILFSVESFAAVP
jgi:hypothetical protein